MKILLVQGSPHKKGSSNMLAEQFMEGAKAAGHTVNVCDAAHANLHPCNGCEACGMAGDCVQHDDMEKARQSILGSDMMVFVTPIYYFGMSAQLKMFIDRFYSFTTQLSSKGMKTFRNGRILLFEFNEWNSKFFEEIMDVVNRHPELELTWLKHESMLSLHGLEIDLVHWRVYCNKQEIKLTSKEYALLCLLVANKGYVLIYNFPIDKLLGERWM